MGERSKDARIPTAQEVLKATIARTDAKPALVLESLYYAQEPDLMAVMRSVAALDLGARLRVLSFARSLAEQSADVAWAGDRSGHD